MQTKRRRQKEFWSIIFCWAACVRLSALSGRENYNCDPFAIVRWRFFVPIEYISHFKEFGAFTIDKRKQRITSNEKMKIILNFLVRFPPKCWMLKPLTITFDCHSIATLSHFLPRSFLQLRQSLACDIALIFKTILRLKGKQVTWTLNSAVR